MNRATKLSAGFVIAIVVTGAVSYYLGTEGVRTTTTARVSLVNTTSTATITVTSKDTTGYLQGFGVQVLDVKANLTRIGNTDNASLVFVIEWKNLSNLTLYYAGGCDSPLRVTILPTSTENITVGRSYPCDLLDKAVMLGPGSSTTSTDPGPWDNKSYFVTGHGRIDTSLTLYWQTTACYPICNSTNSFSLFLSFQV